MFLSQCKDGIVKNNILHSCKNAVSNKIYKYKINETKIIKAESTHTNSHVTTAVIITAALAGRYAHPISTS